MQEKYHTIFFYFSLFWDTKGGYDDRKSSAGDYGPKTKYFCMNMAKILSLIENDKEEDVKVKQVPIIKLFKRIKMDVKLKKIINLFGKNTVSELLYLASNTHFPVEPGNAPAYYSLHFIPYLRKIYFFKIQRDPTDENGNCNYQEIAHYVSILQGKLYDIVRDNFQKNENFKEKKETKHFAQETKRRIILCIKYICDRYKIFSQNLNKLINFSW